MLVFVEVREGHWVSSYVLVPLRWDLSVKLEPAVFQLGVQPVSPSVFPLSPPSPYSYRTELLRWVLGFSTHAVIIYIASTLTQCAIAQPRISPASFIPK